MCRLGCAGVEHSRNMLCAACVPNHLPPAQWHDYLSDATLADAICDRLLHNAHRIVLKGPSRRKESKLDN